MATALILNYDPNARYDCGPNAAGCGRVSNQAALNSGSPTRTGLRTDGQLWSANQRTGFNAAGVAKNNGGPNVAGAPRGINGI